MCGMHSGSRVVAAKALRMGYYGSTINHDVEADLKTCPECYVYASIQRVPKHDLIPITMPWPYLQWGIDICGPFPVAPGNVKSLLNLACHTQSSLTMVPNSSKSQSNHGAKHTVSIGLQPYPTIHKPMVRRRWPIKKLKKASRNKWRNTRLIGWTSSQA
ncbi:hypothetical protein Tco_0972460 [Tanacetum coccineum]